MFINSLTLSRFCSALAAAVLAACACFARAENPVLAPSSSASQGSFLPIWKLLNLQEKQQFVAGYLEGWRDAAKVTDVVIKYVRDNPDQAVSGLERIRTLYDSSELKPNIVAKEIDEFYKKPENHAATFSAALSAVKTRVQSPKSY